MLCGAQASRARKLRGAGLGQDHAEHAARPHPFQRRVRIGQREQRQQLGCNAFAAEAFQGMSQFGAGLFGLGIQFRSEPRLKAVIAQDPQVILGDPCACRADEAHPACGEISEATEEIGNLQRLRMGIERVDGEIAPCGILAPVAGKDDGRAPPIGGDIAAQSGDLDRPILENRGNGAVVDPVGTVRMPAARQRSITASGVSRVAQSTSRTGCPSRLSRTAPPTQRMFSAPAPQSAWPARRGVSIRLRPDHAASFSLSTAMRRARLAMIAAVTPQIRKPCQSSSR